MYARLVLRLCREFGCLPSQLLAEDASLLRLLDTEALGREEGDGG
jgi:hypothetical protein